MTASYRTASPPSEPAHPDAHGLDCDGKKPRCPSQHAGGFILIEAMVTLTVIAIGLSGLLVTQRAGSALTLHGANITGQVNAAGDILELFRLYRDELPTAGFTFVGRRDVQQTDLVGLAETLRSRLGELSQTSPDMILSGRCSASGPARSCSFCLLTQPASPGGSETPVCAGPALL